MPYIITREQRDALHGEATTDLAEIGDIHLALENDDYRLAQTLRRRYEPLLLLLDQIGCEPQPPDDGPDAFEIAMPAPQLAAAARRLTRLALGRLLDHVEHGLAGDTDIARAHHCITVAAACTSLLADVARTNATDEV